MSVAFTKIDSNFLLSLKIGSTNLILIFPREHLFLYDGKLFNVLKHHLFNKSLFVRPMLLHAHGNQISSRYN